jgi:hypothetical protein
MRRILPVAITFAALSLSTIGVRADGTWCAHYGTGLEGNREAWDELARESPSRWETERKPTRRAPR